MNPQFHNPNPNSPIPSIPQIPQTIPKFPSRVPPFPPQQQNPLPILPPSLPSLHTLTTFCDSIFTLVTSTYPLTAPTLAPSSLLQCPHNPHHWVPHHSIFSHFLNCPSPVGLDFTTLQYPRTLQNQGHLNEFVQFVNDPSVDLCFCLDDFVGFESSFFYKDCPGVVMGSSFGGDGAHNRMFSLPGWLSVECANFVSGGGGDGDGGAHNGAFLRPGCLSVECADFVVGGSDGGAHNVGGVVGNSGVRVLPSEIWGVKCEVECWNDCPNSYSFSVVRAMLCLKYVNVCDLEKWAVGNSLRFGVVVDVPMSKHMVVLFRLCLKAIVREAAKNYGSCCDDNHGCFDPKSLSFECPTLVGALKWLILQMSILYGEMKAKLFVLSMLKHWLPKAASYASLFPLDKRTDQLPTIEEGSSVFKDENSANNEGVMRGGDGIFSQSIFVYQIAAAIAALHERSLLEERIKALRNPLQLTAFQRNAEHAYFSKKADEERRKRPNYRALIEHDGLPSQKQHNEDSDEGKTVEELMAEERDYKRRRTSYRGKKLNRNAKEVMRDIIEDYTEAIKQAGGIGCLAKEDGQSFPAQNTSVHDSRNFKSNHYSKSDQQDDHRKLSRNEYNHKDAKYSDNSSRRNDHYRNDHRKRRHVEDQETAHKDRYDRYNRGRSPSRDERRGQRRESRCSSRNSSVKESYVDGHSKGYHSSDRSRHYDDRKSQHSGREDKRKLEYTDGHRQQKSDERSESSGRIKLNDRYDPSEASYFYEDEFEDSKYIRP